MGDLILTEKGRRSLRGLERDYMKIVEEISRIAGKYKQSGKGMDDAFGGFFKVER
jgi:hypothetical protein